MNPEESMKNEIQNILIDKKWNYERIFSTIACKLNTLKEEELVCIDTNIGVWFIKKHNLWELIQSEQTVDWILNDWVANYIRQNIDNQNISKDEILNVLKFTSFVKESRHLFYNTVLSF